MSSKEDRIALAGTLGVPLKSLTLALVHSSLANEVKQPSNEVRALLGDSILRTVLVERMMSDGASKKGVITQDIATLVSNGTCAVVARNLGLEPHVLVSAGFQTRPFPDSVLATVIEALIGGLYLDVDWTTAREFVLRHWPASNTSTSLDLGL